MFLSGVVKLASSDPAWADLTALSYHYETQPLPAWTAWYAHHLPDGLLRFGTGAGITWGSQPQREWQETELKASRPKSSVTRMMMSSTVL
mgnify:CR=1 FL=1